MKSKSEIIEIIVRSIVRFICPKLVMTRPESIEAIKHLNARLQEQREETAKWRTRCQSVEQTYARQLTAMREAAQEHEGLSWRCL